MIEIYFNLMFHHFPGGSEEGNENHSHNNRPQGRNLNLGHLKYEAGVPTFQLLIIQED
jgi:hypothetical protein